MSQEDHLIHFPAADETLWRYMDFTKFVDLLETQSLHFARADRLGDPFEGFSLKRHYSVAFPGVEDFSTEDRAILDNMMSHSIRQNTFINCWHHKEYESAAMWRLYSRELDGVAIKSDYNCIVDSIPEQYMDKIRVGQVVYIDGERDTVDTEVQLIHFLAKRLEFEHENEIRLIYYVETNDNLIRADAKQVNFPNGLNVPVEVSKLVREVIVDPKAESWFVDLVGSVATRYGLGERVKLSALAGPPDWEYL